MTNYQAVVVLWREYGGMQRNFVENQGSEVKGHPQTTHHTSYQSVDWTGTNREVVSHDYRNTAVSSYYVGNRSNFGFLRSPFVSPFR